MKLNDELIQLYIKGMSNRWFGERSNTNSGCCEEWEDSILVLENMSGLRHGASRHTNPEWAEAQKVLNSPLMKALG